MMVPFLLTVLSALLYALSFPPTSFFPLAWVAPVPFFLSASMVRPVYAAGYGILWGILVTYGVGWWFPEMLVHYFAVSLVVGWLGFLAVSIGLIGIYYGAFAMWLSWLVRRQAANPFTIAAGWGVCEFARANLLGGNPWVLSGYSQVPLNRLMQLADAAGPYGIGMLIAAVSALFAGFCMPALRGRRFAISSTGIAAVFSFAFLYGEWRLSQTFTTGEPVEVAVIQGAVERQFRWNPEHRTASLDRYLALTKEVSAARPRFIFWPEYAVDFYLQEKVPERQALLNMTRDLGADLILGGLSYGYGVSDFFYRNSVFLLRRGRITGRYDKIRLLPFAEEATFGRRFSRDRLTYEPGRRLRTLRAGNAQIGAFVCFEAMYSDVARTLALQGAEVFTNPANDDWLGYAAPARHHLDIATVRAIENRRYLVRPTATGFSAIIDPYGRTLARSSFGTPTVLTGAIRLSQVQTPYQRWGDAAAWIAVAWVTAVSLYSLAWRKRK
jgi:apolipoprotein N-acyltransferase